MSPELPNGPAESSIGTSSVERERLHSLKHRVECRLFGCMLVAGIPIVVASEIGAAETRGVLLSIGQGALLVVLLALASWFVWNACPTVVATRAGLEVGRGKKLRLIPWHRVHDVRELPWVRFSPPWQPKRFQVDLTGGGAFDFVGVRDSREIVLGFWERQRSG